jgi:hypothetical protein
MHAISVVAGSIPPFVSQERASRYAPEFGACEATDVCACGEYVHSSRPIQKPKRNGPHVIGKIRKSLDTCVQAKTRPSRPPAASKRVRLARPISFERLPGAGIPTRPPILYRPGYKRRVATTTIGALSMADGKTMGRSIFVKAGLIHIHHFSRPDAGTWYDDNDGDDDDVGLGAYRRGVVIARRP